MLVTPASDAHLFAEGMSSTISASACAGAVLQPRMPAGGLGMVQVEGTEEIQGQKVCEKEPEGAMPAPQGPNQAQEETGFRSPCRRCEGHSQKTLFPLFLRSSRLL
jgi:hypothetical protein